MKTIGGKSRIRLATAAGIFSAVVYLGGAAASMAAALSADGDFNAQTAGNPLIAPWNSPNSLNLAKCAEISQSPFTNLFAQNGKGAFWTNTAGPYFIQSVTPITPAVAGTVYMNADVKIPFAGTGGFRLFLSQAGGSKAQVVLHIRSDGIYAQSGSSIVGQMPVCGVMVGEWYNLQLAIDMNAMSYSGAVIRASSSERTRFPAKVFSTATNYITHLGTDVTVGNVGACIDNWVLSDTPLASPPCIDTGYLSYDGDFGFQTTNATLTTPWTRGGNPLPTCSADYQSPFTNAFANNGKGGNLASPAASYPYFYHAFPSVSNVTFGAVYFNVDVMIPTNTAEGGARLFVSGSGGSSPSALVRVRTTGILRKATVQLAPPSAAFSVANGTTFN
ncbi:MAG: hypothetical protein PHR35_05055 [Kiritimatiellae bacterium]|nr:hypothetical protein [Kiritimatiellia bacterium]